MLLSVIVNSICFESSIFESRMRIRLRQYSAPGGASELVAFGSAAPEGPIIITRLKMAAATERKTAFMRQSVP